MADPTNLNSSWRSVLAIFALLFQIGMIVYLVRWGDSTNSLHQSALGWSYVTGLLLLGAIGLVNGVEAVLPLMRKA